MSEMAHQPPESPQTPGKDMPSEAQVAASAAWVMTRNPQILKRVLELGRYQNAAIREAEDIFGIPRPGITPEEEIID